MYDRIRLWCRGAYDQQPCGTMAAPPPVLSLANAFHAIERHLPVAGSNTQRDMATPSPSRCSRSKLSNSRRGALVEPLLGHAVETLDPVELAGGRIDGEDQDAAVGQRLASRGEIGHVVDHQHAAGDGPGRFELAVGHDSLIERRGPAAARPVGRRRPAGSRPSRSWSRTGTARGGWWVPCRPGRWP